MLAAVSARIKAQIRQGMKLADAIAAGPTADFDDAWGKGFLPPPSYVEVVWKNLQSRGARDKSGISSQSLKLQRVVRRAARAVAVGRP